MLTMLSKVQFAAGVMFSSHRLTDIMGQIFCLMIAALLPKNLR